MLIPIVERILSGEDVCPGEIKEHNASQLLAWIRAEDRHHTKETCRRGKDCVHAPGPDTFKFAMVLLQEMVEACTCGDHRRDVAQLVRAPL